MRQVRIRIMAAALVLALLPAVFAGEPSATLSPSEEQLAVQIGFGADILLLAKEATGHPLHRLSGYDEDGYQIMASGFIATVARSRSDEVLLSLREKLKPRRYMVFVIESISTLKTDKIAVVRGTEPFEILSIMYTNGDEDGLSHDDVLDTLKAWSKKYSFEIVGAGNDWVEIEFRVLPQDMKAFAEEVYDFSPDAVDEGAGSIAALIREVSATRRLLLWWE